MNHYATSLGELDERPTRAMVTAGRAATELGLRVVGYEWAPFIGNLVRVTDGTRYFHISRWGCVSDSDENGILGREHHATFRFRGYINGVHYLANVR